MVTLGRVTYPETVDDPTKSLIFDWFQYREVCDNEKFNVFFNRVLTKSMRKYNQLLRIQPGEVITFEDGSSKAVNYDWMIQNYHELQHTTEEDIDVAETTSGSNTVNRDTRDVKDDYVMTSGRDTTNKNTTASSSGETGTVSESYSKHTNHDLASETDARFDRDLTDRRDADMHNDTINDSNDKTLGKSAPQSQSYLGTSGMPTTLDWQYPGSQGETSHHDAGGTWEHGNDQTRQGGWTKDHSKTTQTGYYDDEGNGRSTVNTSSYGVGQDNTTLNTSRSTINQGTVTGESTETGASSGEKTGYTSHDTLHREMMQGRSLDIATILENAKNFILGSSAWDFLYGEIDKCFISIYND